MRGGKYSAKPAGKAGGVASSTCPNMEKSKDAAVLSIDEQIKPSALRGTQRRVTSRVIQVKAAPGALQFKQNNLNST